MNKTFPLTFRVSSSIATYLTSNSDIILNEAKELSKKNPTHTNIVDSDLEFYFRLKKIKILDDTVYSTTQNEHRLNYKIILFPSLTDKKSLVGVTSEFGVIPEGITNFQKTLHHVMIKYIKQTD